MSKKFKKITAFIVSLLVVSASFFIFLTVNNTYGFTSGVGTTTLDTNVDPHLISKDGNTVYYYTGDGIWQTYNGDVYSTTEIGAMGYSNDVLTKTMNQYQTNVSNVNGGGQAGQNHQTTDANNTLSSIQLQQYAGGPVYTYIGNGNWTSSDGKGYTNDMMINGLGFSGSALTGIDATYQSNVRSAGEDQIQNGQPIGAGTPSQQPTPVEETIGGAKSSVGQDSAMDVTATEPAVKKCDNTLPYSTSADLKAFWPLIQCGHAGQHCCDFKEAEILINRVINWFLSMAIIIMGGTLTYAGVNIIFNPGNATVLKESQEMFKKSIIGLFIVLFAWLIIHTIITALVNPSVNADRFMK